RRSARRGSSVPRRVVEQCCERTRVPALARGLAGSLVRHGAVGCEDREGRDVAAVVRFQQWTLGVGRVRDVDDDEAHAVADLRIERDHAFSLAIRIPTVRGAEEYERGAALHELGVTESIALDREAAARVVGEAQVRRQPQVLGRARPRGGDDRHERREQQRAPSRSSGVHGAANAAAPTFAISSSSWGVLPLTPIAPTTLPAAVSGMPPWRGVAPGSARAATRPFRICSSNSRLGRWKIAAVRALPMPTSTLATCVSSRRWRTSKWLPSSTTAITTVACGFAA